MGVTILVLLTMAASMTSMVSGFYLNHPTSQSLASIPAWSVAQSMTTSSAQQTAIDQYTQVTTADFYNRLQTNDGDIKTGQLVHEGVGGIAWVASSGLIWCYLSLQIWDIKSNNVLSVNNDDKPRTSSCDLEYIKEKVNELIQKGITYGIDAFVMKEIGEAIVNSISAKYGW